MEYIRLSVYGLIAISTSILLMDLWLICIKKYNLTRVPELPFTIFCLVGCIMYLSR